MEYPNASAIQVKRVGSRVNFGSYSAIIMMMQDIHLYNVTVRIAVKTKR